MSHHRKTVCKECGIIMMQCRCPAEKYDISYSVCDKCRKGV